MTFKILFLMTLVPAVYLAFRRDGDFVVVGVVILGSWGVSLASWPTTAPIWSNAVGDVLCAAFIAVLCRETACLFVGLLFGGAASISLIYGMYIFPETTYDPLYAHALSVMGHTQNIALAVGASDDGIRSRFRNVLRAVGAAVAGVGFRRRRADLEDRKTR